MFHRFTDGLREGATAENDSDLQRGFSDGVNTTVPLIMKLSSLRGELSGRVALSSDDTNHSHAKILLADITTAETALRTLLKQHGQPSKDLYSSLKVKTSLSENTNIENLVTTTRQFLDSK